MGSPACPTLFVIPARMALGSGDGFDGSMDCPAGVGLPDESYSLVLQPASPSDNTVITRTGNNAAQADIIFFIRVLTKALKRFQYRLLLKRIMRPVMESKEFFAERQTRFQV